MKTSDVVSAYCFLLIFFFNPKCGCLWLCCCALTIDLLSLRLVHNKHLLEILTLPLLQLHLLLGCREIHVRDWPQSIQAGKCCHVCHTPSHYRFRFRRLYLSPRGNSVYSQQPKRQIQYERGYVHAWSSLACRWLKRKGRVVKLGCRWQSNAEPRALVWQITGNLFGRRRRLRQGANGSVNLAPALCSSPASSLFPFGMSLGIQRLVSCSPDSLI